MNKNTLDAAIDQRPRQQARLAMAQCALEDGSFGAASAIAEKIVAREPDHLSAWEVLAKAHWRGERFEEALVALDRLITLNPYEPGYFYMRGLICQSTGRYGDAIEAMTRCLAFETSVVADQAMVALRELEAWQEALIAEGLAADATFRAEYARNPMEACAKRGYRFSSSERKDQLNRQLQTAQALVWARVD